MTVTRAVRENWHNFDPSTRLQILFDVRTALEHEEVSQWRSHRRAWEIVASLRKPNDFEVVGARERDGDKDQNEETSSEDPAARDHSTREIFSALDNPLEGT